MNHEEILDKAKNFIISELKDNIISLYLAGTYMTEDMNSNSDLDLFAIVSENFNMKEEEIINKKLKLQNFPVPVNFRAIGYDELNTGKIRGNITQWLSPKTLIKYFPHYRLLYGKKINFNDLKLKPSTPKEEAKVLIRRFKLYFTALKKGKILYPVNCMPKKILYLIKCQAEAEDNFFTTSYKKIVEHYNTPFVNKIGELRNRNIDKEDLLKIDEDLQLYMKDLNKKMRNWI